MEAYISVSELINYMKEHDLVMIHRNLVEQENLRKKYMSRKSLSLKEIADAKLWGIPSKTGVRAIVDKEILEHEIFKKKNAHYIMRSAVERIAKNRGII